MMASLIIIITLLTSELQAISQFAAQYFSAFPTNVNVMSISIIRNNLNFTFFSLQATRTLPHVIQVRWSVALKVQRSYLPTPLASYVTISWKGSNERRIHNIVFFSASYSNNVHNNTRNHNWIRSTCHEIYLHSTSLSNFTQQMTKGYCSKTV